MHRTLEMQLMQVQEQLVSLETKVYLLESRACNCGMNRNEVPKEGSERALSRSTANDAAADCAELSGAYIALLWFGVGAVLLGVLHGSLIKHG